MARTPGVRKNYGYMNWSLSNEYVDDDGETRPSLPPVPASSVRFTGAGANIVYIDWENDEVVVVRWHRGGLDEFIGKVLSSIETPTPTDNGGTR